MILVIYTFKCDLCGKEKSEQYANNILAQNPILKLPSGWHQSSEGHICDNHIITITDKPTEEEISE